MSQVVICTPDKDLGQCVVGTRVVQLDRRRGSVIDEAGVRAKFGVGPASIPDYLALVGDSADGFPGLPGWGAKTTAAVLARYEHLEAIPDAPGEWDVPVRNGAGLAADPRRRSGGWRLLFRDLATLRTRIGAQRSRGAALDRAPTLPSRAWPTMLELDSESLRRARGRPWPRAADASGSGWPPNAGGCGRVNGHRAASRWYQPGCTSTAPSETRWGVAHCTSSSRPAGAGSATAATRATRATLDASVWRWNIDSPANRPPMATPYSPPASRPSAVPGLDAVDPAELVQPAVGPLDVPADPRPRPVPVGAGLDHLVERRVDPDLVTGARLAQRTADPQP